MENFPQSFEPVGSDSILEQFIQLKNKIQNILTNEIVKTTPQNLTEEQKEQARENIGAGSATINIIDNLLSQSSIDALSANQGRVLNNKIDISVYDLQNEIDANGGDIASLQGDVSELNQEIARTLKTPLSTPAETQVVGIDDNGDQINLNVRNGLSIVNNTIIVEHPVGSLYFCKHGSNSPASIFGGTWNKIADNVVIPLGNIAPVKTSSSDVVTGAQNRTNLRYTSGGTVETSHYLMSYDGGLYNSRSAPTDPVAGIYFSNLVAESQNSISGIDIWWRES